MRSLALGTNEPWCGAFASCIALRRSRGSCSTVEVNITGVLGGVVCVKCVVFVLLFCIGPDIQQRTKVRHFARCINLFMWVVRLYGLCVTAQCYKDKGKYTTSRHHFNTTFPRHISMRPTLVVGPTHPPGTSQNLGKCVAIKCSLASQCQPRRGVQNMARRRGQRLKHPFRGAPRMIWGV